MALRKILASIIASVWLPLDGSGTLYGQPVEEGKIYWTEARDLGWIQRSNLDGSNLESLLTTDIVAELKINPRRIALDRFGKIYWTDWHEDTDEVTVRRANVDGSDVETLLTGVHAQDFALDVVWYYLYDPCPVCITGTPPDSSPNPDRRTAAKTAASVGAPTKMYWTERNGKSHTIRRSNLDGSNVETLVTGLGRPSSLVADAYHGKNCSGLSGIRTLSAWPTLIDPILSWTWSQMLKIHWA